MRMPQVDVPVVVAPMAGGPSTPALIAAAADASAFGFLAAGYLTADALATQLAETRARTAAPFGVNVFVPSEPDDDPAAALAFRARLAPLARHFGVAPLPVPFPDDDGWEAKLAVLAADPVAVVSFTFGVPPREVVAGLQARGTCVWASVASVPDAVAAAGVGVDALVVQGAEAGGHRATLLVADEPAQLGTLDLVRAVGAVTDVALVAAGGVSDAAGVRAALDAGAWAVQCGTAFLRCEEAGTSATHRAALADPDLTDTVVTRAFTGRPARGLANAWTAAFADAPAAYPSVHQVTRSVRAAAAAAGDVQHTHLWAGTGWRSASDAPAAEIVASLTP